MFEIEIQNDGIMCDVTQDRRAFLYDCDDVEEAWRRIRSRSPRTQPHEVVVIDPDGYRMTLDRYR